METKIINKICLASTVIASITRFLIRKTLMHTFYSVTILLYVQIDTRVIVLFPYFLSIAK